MLMGSTLWKIGGQTVDLSENTLIMGVLNVTPDSFSDGGEFFSTEQAVEQGKRMAAEGAQIIQVGGGEGWAREGAQIVEGGGEPPRRGSEGVSFDEELARVLPVIEELRGSI